MVIQPWLRTTNVFSLMMLSEVRACIHTASGQGCTVQWSASCTLTDPIFRSFSACKYFTLLAKPEFINSKQILNMINGHAHKQTCAHIWDSKFANLRIKVIVNLELKPIII